VQPEPIAPQAVHSWERRIPLLIAVIFVVLALAGAATRAPWCDEAYFAEPAYQILKIGKMATLVSPPSPVDDPRTFGTDQYIFWTLPLDIVLQAAWYKVVGFGMIRMRALSLLWGLVAIWAWWMILKKLGADARMRVVALALIALDYAFLRGSSEGRMDVMSAALGFLGIAIFVLEEERNYTRAIFFGACCAGASTLTHPIGGMVATAALGLTILWNAKGRFRWWHPLVAAVPYLFFFGAWGLYIAQAPDIFRRQLLTISGGRLSAWRAPLAAMASELTQRWAGPFGLTGPFGLRQIRVLVLVAYTIGFGWALLRFRSLTKSGLGLLCAVPLLEIVVLCFADSTKNAAYLVHVIPWLGACLAIPIARYWRRGGAVVFTAVLAVQIFGSAYLASRMEYQRVFQPAVSFIEQHGGHVTGEAQLGFGLGFGDTALIDDHRLGFYTGAKTPLFAMDRAYDIFMEGYRVTHPEIYSYLTAKLARSKLVFENAQYRIYQDSAAQ